MNGIKDDLTTKKVLFDFIGKLGYFKEEQERKRLRRLWKEIDTSSSLLENIESLTKFEMDTIRKKLDIKNASSLKKAELAKKLERCIPGQAEKNFMFFDEERYKLVKEICDNDGIAFAQDIASLRAEYFKNHGIIFPYLKEGKRVLVMPQEVIAVFRSIDGPEIKSIVKQNTEWIRLTNGLLYYYGVAGLGQLCDMMGKLTGEETSIMRYIRVLYHAMMYYGQIRMDMLDYVCDSRVIDPETLLNGQNSRSSVEYCSFTKEQLYKASEPGYIDKTPALNDFIGFMLDNYKMTRPEVWELTQQCVNIINSGSELGDLIQYLQGRLEFTNVELVQQLLEKMTNLFNTTRMWVLKGHAPVDLSHSEKQNMKHLPTQSFHMDKPHAKVIHINTRSKIGRNEPCPCGSGKKYKKCCLNKQNDNLTSHQLDQMMQNGYRLTESEDNTSACSIWLEVWNNFKKQFIPEMRRIEDAEVIFNGSQYLSNWCQDLEQYLEAAGLVDETFFKKRIEYCREFCSFFPESDDSIIHNMKRAIAESYFALGMEEQGEKEFQLLIQEYPKNVWGYIGWADMYCIERTNGKIPKDYERAKSLYNNALQNCTAYSAVVKERLEDLEYMKKKLDSKK